MSVVQKLLLVMAIAVAAAEMAVISAFAHNASVCTTWCSECYNKLLQIDLNSYVSNTSSIAANSTLLTNRELFSFTAQIFHYHIIAAVFQYLSIILGISMW